MTETARIVVEYDADYAVDEPGHHQIVVEGPVDRSFLELLSAVVPASTERSRIFLLAHGAARHERVLMLLDAEVTLGQVAELFEYETLYADNSGRGGDSNWVTVSEVFGAVGPVGKAMRAAKGIYGVVTGIQYADERTAIKDWDDTGVISMKLRQMVLRESTWRRSHFDAVFALSRDRGGVLLRELGYWRSSIDDNNIEFWKRAEDDAWKLPPKT